MLRKDRAALVLSALLGLSIGIVPQSEHAAFAPSYYYYSGGAYSDDVSALPNVGLRALIDVSSQPGPTGSAGYVTPYISDDLSNDIWIQAGYTASLNAVPRGFYQVWSLTNNTVLANGYFSILRGPHLFAIYLKSGTTWAVSYDNNEVASFATGSSVSSSTYPVYSFVELSNSVQNMYTFYTVSFPIAMQVIKSPGESWTDVKIAKSYGGSFTAEGQQQNGAILANQLNVGKYIALIPTGSTLWNNTLGEADNNANNLAPVLKVPSAIVVTASDDSGTDVTYDVTAADTSMPITIGPYCTPESGSIFPIGTTTVDCTVTDGSGTTTTANFTVTVLPPTTSVSQPSDAPQDTPDSPVSVSIDNPAGGSVISGAVNVTVDASSSSVISTIDLYIDDSLQASNPSSPANFIIDTSTLSDGSHNIRAVATDSSDNQGSAELSIVVHNQAAGSSDNNNTPPTIVVPAPIVAEATSISGTTVSYSVTAADSSGNNLVPDCDHPSGSTFPVGITKVTCKASDPSGNEASATFSVTVSDTTAPTVSITNPSDGSSVNGMVSVNIDASDNTSIQSVAIYVDGKLKATDTTSPYSFNWNAQGGKPGSHTILATATDSYGNHATATVNVNTK